MARPAPSMLVIGVGEARTAVGVPAWGSIMIVLISSMVVVATELIVLNGSK